MPTPIQPGQTLLFLGDHTSPGVPAYVGTMRDIIERFYPDFHLNFLSSGSEGQTARGLRSSTLMQLILSSKPDWLVVGIGLTDALREPAARDFFDSEDAKPQKLEADEADATFGPELRPRRYKLASPEDSGRVLEPEIRHVAQFKDDLLFALNELQEAGVNRAVLTTVLAGDDPRSPLNMILRAYNRAIREAANQTGSLVVDVERAYWNVLDRAVNYKQTVALASERGQANPQGQALLARTTLAAFGLLPQPGQRPAR